MSVASRAIQDVIGHKRRQLQNERYTPTQRTLEHVRIDGMEEVLRAVEKAEAKRVRMRGHS